jgi:hypothetical protein
MRLPAEVQRRTVPEIPQIYDEGFDRWAARSAYVLDRTKEALYAHALTTPEGYQGVVQELITGLDTFSSPEDQAARLHLLLNLDLGECIHPLAEPFFSYLEQLPGHGSFEEVSREQIPKYGFTQEDMVFLDHFFSGSRRIEGLTGEVHPYTQRTHPAFVAEARTRFRRFLDRLIHIEQQAHSYQFNSPEQGREIARLLVHSPFFYKKIIELNTLFYASGSAEFPLPLFSPALLNTILSTYHQGGDTALQALWKQPAFMHEVAAGMNSQTTGVGRFRQQTERVVRMVQENGWESAWLNVYGSGLLQTADMVQGLCEAGIDCSGVGYDRLPVDQLLQRSRIFEYPDGEGTPGRLMSREEVTEYIRQRIGKDSLVQTNIAQPDDLNWNELQRVDLRNLHTNRVFVATNSVVPHLDTREQLLAIRKMFSARSAVLYIEGMYYPVRKAIYGVQGTMTRTEAGVRFNPRTVSVLDNWDTKSAMVPDVDARGPLPLVHPADAQKKHFYYDKRVSMDMSPYIESPGS